LRIMDSAIIHSTEDILVSGVDLKRPANLPDIYLAQVRENGGRAPIDLRAGRQQRRHAVPRHCVNHTPQRETVVNDVRRGSDRTVVH